MKESVKDLGSGRPSADVFEPNCPSRALLDHVTSRWGVLVLLTLASGTMRWGEVRRQVRGVSEKMLASTLRALEADGLVERRAHAVVPPRVDYSLSERGKEVVSLLSPLVDWVVSTTVADAEAAS
ncbi:helix-turn-helix domain-containing protein [Streptomyces sp. NPDC026665]|uniref:winged helix-turn-helix transcriptional regulator n=1 Tax=Streptomyces sp. NPDC026665 TaxID=3154798 RepID=UPI0033C2455F